ncbi:major facilitator superfamily transporter [Ameyamaea chiangmaiensis NBRC 103196]|uniref:Sugar porter family MFS transporter n=1 Tax=Ameyamaea chiangmaiensis TaxID=442969 RepID=A0A850PBU5_9PROT|nr:sugar porter family MFS transporter [Ameyamaea chiangmaiensis]MBS4075011.1 sugar porter family MFS transporter [Ameyamaea chiangmaiensis]NVN41418.1 sugar porter family MFS transporter [Ameyamaea chiangmaiensis]GBQ65791.1 major facilitator superfamily transporter [Ameyamaea chiangmaiensis NBRC 103196]
MKKLTDAQKLVRNIVMVVTMGALAFGYDTGVIAGALPFMQNPLAQGGLGLTPLTEGLVTSALVLGAAFGSLACGIVADRVGRRDSLIGLSVVFMIGAIGTSQAPSIPVMILMRGVLGFAVGGASALVPMFISEMAPPSRRGQLVSQNEMMIVTGQLAAYVLSAVLAKFFGVPGIWRTMLLIAAVPAILLGGGLFFVPRSPRWLASRGRTDDARRVLELIRSTDRQVRKEMVEIDAQVSKEADQLGWGEALREPWIRRLLMLGIGLGFAAQFTGVNAFMYFTPIILTRTGLGTEAALVATISAGVVAVIATFFGIWMIGRFPRRFTLLGGLGGVVFAHVGLGVTLLLLDGSPVQSVAALGFILLALLFIQMMVSPLYWLLMSELFPVRARGVLTGLSVAAQWLCNATVAFLFPVVLHWIGAYTFFVFAAINVLSLMFVAKVLPETRGMSLERLEQHLEAHFSPDIAAGTA